MTEGPPHRPLLLGLDLGTSRIKALLVDRAGTELAAASVLTPFRSQPSGIEMTVAALRDAVAEVLGRLGAAVTEVAAAGVGGLAESGAPLDRHGQPLAPIIAWHDPRGEASVAALERRFGDELSSRIGQRPRTVSSVAKLGWLVDEGLDGVHRWLGVPELCLFALTGASATDFSLAARTGCYDVACRRWLPEVTDALDIPAGVFPTVAPAGSVLGHVTPAGSAWSGLRSGIPVTLAGHDHLAALAGCGSADDDFGNSVGTAETVVARTAELPDIDLALTRRTAVTLVPDGAAWAILSGAARAGRVLGVAATALGRSFEDLDALAGSAVPLAMGDLLSDLQAGDTSGLRVDEPGRVWAGLLHALVERTQDAVARATEVVGPPTRLVIFGGGSRSRPWLAAKARASATPVWRSTTGEAAARGAAAYAGVAAGWWRTVGEAPPVALEEVRPPPSGEAGAGMVTSSG